ncbi:MAG: hypothetical protein B7Z54_09235 [Sphingobacteriales bacterium 12-47-4]|nr:MAG: hypothetical protein B7Z54_09235 [Sphingobacteriales bacterium 12-47-4]
MKKGVRYFLNYILNIMDFRPTRIDEQLKKYSSKTETQAGINKDWKLVLTDLNMVLWNMEEKLEILENHQTQKHSPNMVE